MELSPGVVSISDAKYCLHRRYGDRAWYETADAVHKISQMNGETGLGGANAEYAWFKDSDWKPLGKKCG
jgi:hypothetical protein